MNDKDLEILNKHLAARDLSLFFYDLASVLKYHPHLPILLSELQLTTAELFSILTLNPMRSSETLLGPILKFLKLELKRTELFVYERKSDEML